MSNILGRLPAKCIFQLWQTNSKDLLYGLTKDPYFMRTHLERGRATPTIVVQSHTALVIDIKLFLFDGKAENVEAKRLDLSSYNAYCEGKPIILWDSYDGFLLFRVKHGPAHFCIWNPITKERLILTSPNTLFYVCGFYFHPRNKEYEVVCVSCDGARVNFQILGLRTKHKRNVGSCSHPPSRERPPVFINGTLYWIVDRYLYLLLNKVQLSLLDSILSFNMETEEFRTIEAVTRPNNSPLYRRYHDYQFYLFEVEGKLSLFDPSSKTDVVVWMLNYDTKCWVKKHSVRSPDYNHHWNFYSYFDEIEYIKMKGELIAYHSWDRYKQPYIYNLGLGTWKCFDRKGIEGDRFTTRIHTHSIISLDAADSVIPLDW